MNALYDFSKQILKNIDTWLDFVPLDEEAGDRWHLERLFILPPYQVEKVMIAPETRVPEHLHLHVSTFEIYVSGEFSLRVGNHQFVAHPGLKPHRRIIPIPPCTWHTGDFPTGGVFISVQKWINGPPRHISEDWWGAVVEEKTSRIDTAL